MAEVPSSPATPSPVDDRRKKQVMRQKAKARHAAGEANNHRPSTPDQQKASPVSTSTPLKSTAYVSLRRKQIIEKRRNKMTSPSTIDGSVSKEERQMEEAPSHDEEEKEHSHDSPSEEKPVSSKNEEKGSPKDPPGEVMLQRSQSEDEDIAITNNVEENAASSPKEDRNDKVELDKKSSWDTRSIHDFPPEPAVDPTWDASKVLFENVSPEKAEMGIFDAAPWDLTETQVNGADLEQGAARSMTQAEGISLQDDKNAGSDVNPSEFNIFDTDSWAVTDVSFLFKSGDKTVDIEKEAARVTGEDETDVKNLDCSLDVEAGVNGNGLATSVARLLSISEGVGVKAVEDSIDVGPVVSHDGMTSDDAPSTTIPDIHIGMKQVSTVSHDGTTSDFAPLRAITEIQTGMKQVDISLDVHMGVEDNNMASNADRLLRRTTDDDGETLLRAAENEKDVVNGDDIDFSATVFENVNEKKDDEALLGSDQVRSDVADGMESDAYYAVRLINQVEQQKRLEQYEERSDGDSSSAGDDEVDPEDDSDDDDFADDEDVHYISADSEDEEELVRHCRSAPPVPEIIRDMSSQGATFAAAVSAALGAHVTGDEVVSASMSAKDRSELQREKLEGINTNSSSGSVKGDSSAVESSVASSALFGAGLSLAGTSVYTDVTGGVARGDSPIARETLQSAPPPPPPSQPKKKSSKIATKQKSLLKIPPPPHEKLIKWEEQKMRPFMHLQAVADAKARSSEQARQVEEATASDYVSLSLMTSISSSHSHDEIETTLAGSVAEEDNAALSSLERTENATTTQIDLDERERSACLDASQTTQQTQDMSFLDARSIGATSNSASFALLSPPHVSRTKLGEAAGLAPGEDGIWKEDSIRKAPHSVKKSKSPLSDSKMAERFTMASSTAARKFEEKYGDVDEEANIVESTSTECLKKATSEEAVNQEERPSTSYFCSPDMLGGPSFCQPSSSDAIENDDGNLLSHLSTRAKSWASMDRNESNAKNIRCPRQRAMLDSSFDDTHHAGLELVGGAFSTWKNSDYAYGSEAGVKDPALPSDLVDRTVNAAAEDVRSEERQLLSWLENDVLAIPAKAESDNGETKPSLDRAKLLSLLQDDANFNSLCKYASENVVILKSPDDSKDPCDDGPIENANEWQRKTKPLRFFIPTERTKRPRSSILAANFLSFLNRIALLSGVQSPFKDENPFLMDVLNMSFLARKKTEKIVEVEERTVQELIFEHELGDIVDVVRFFFDACGTPSPEQLDKTKDAAEADEAADEVTDIGGSADPFESMSLLYKIPSQSPSPFETASWNLPSIVAIVLGFLGDPVAVCRVKMINHFCNRLIQENEHVIMRDTVRLGGISMHIRPAFWMWIALEKCGRTTTGTGAPRGGDQPTQATGQDHAEDASQPQCITAVLPQLEKRGREGKWHHVIQRDVSRAFGNMPPHKTGARLRTDSIVRALVTWGRGRVLSRGVKGGGVSSPTPVIPPPGTEKAKPKPRPATGPPPWETADSLPEKEDDSVGQPDTVSQWSGISPVPSFCSNSGLSDKESGSMAARASLANGVARALEKDPTSKMKNSRAIEELALSGNTLTAEMKEGLQNQLGYILHALAAAHEDVGYCQGMDYIVAHLLRVLQDTVRWHSVRGTLSPVIKAQPAIPNAGSDEQSLTKEIDQAIDSSLVVEETVFRVMDTFLTTYNLRHMYWPELRCLKTCCRVFERLIQLKLPVLADHFAYHELNVGLFALGWFQTLFLYLPSMPSATVCHMWDIWLVERSFKIFFRVGTAILFLSQPILLNHELEGMMTYLNTFPDATLLNPDILIACALQIKVTNRMLAEIERDLTGGY